MTAIKKLLRHPIVPNLSSAQCAQYSLTASGITLMIGGVLKLPSLGLSENGLLVAVLVLIAMMLLCVATGQLFVIADELKQIREQRSR